MIIYLITNKLNGHQYVGKTTTSLEKRWKRHINVSKCRYLSFAIQKYGKDNFTIEEITSYTNMEDLNNAEEYFIEFYNCLAPNGYNLTLGGKGGKHSEETKRKISESLKGNKFALGNKHSDETKAKMSSQRKGSLNGMFGVHRFGKDGPHYGKLHTEESKKKMSASQKGKKRTPEQNKVNSEARKGNKNHFYGKKHTEEAKLKISLARKANAKK